MICQHNRIQKWIKKNKEGSILGYLYCCIDCEEIFEFYGVKVDVNLEGGVLEGFIKTFTVNEDYRDLMSFYDNVRRIAKHTKHLISKGIKEDTFKFVEVYKSKDNYHGLST